MLEAKYLLSKINLVQKYKMWYCTNQGNLLWCVTHWSGLVLVFGGTQRKIEMCSSIVVLMNTAAVVQYRVQLVQGHRSLWTTGRTSSSRAQRAWPWWPYTDPRIICCSHQSVLVEKEFLIKRSTAMMNNSSAYMMRSCTFLYFVV